MAKANPKKWFPSKFSAHISLRKVDRYDEYSKTHKPYFDTWEEAHAQSVAWAAKDLDDAKRDAMAAKRAIKAAHTRIEKVAALKPPN